MKEKIFILDDQPNTVLPLQLYLELHEFTIELFTDATALFKRTEAERPDLFLLDVQMPDMNGYDVCRKLKSNPLMQSIPVMFLTAQHGEEDIVKGFEAGGVDYITKPFQQKEVLARISTHLTIQKQKHELTKLNRSKDKFFSILAHDLQSPFNTLLGYSHCLNDCLRTDASLDRVQHFAQQIQLSSERFYRLLENLLMWSQVQRGTLDVRPSTVCVDGLVHIVIHQFHDQLDYKKIEIRFEPPSEVLLEADETILRIVIQNIVSNAIKFTPRNGHITITLSQDERQVRLTVSDSGEGIPQDRLPDIFQETEPKPGTVGEIGVGLGLALCKSLLELQQGTIEIQSQPGEGAIFTMIMHTSE